MLRESDYIYYANVLEDRLALCQYRADRGRLQKPWVQKRTYKVYVEDRIPEFDIEPQINAFSFYDEQIDRIFIMRNLVNFFAAVLNEVSETQTQYSWMFHVVLYFCGFHEFGHLYLGHCQLMPSCKLAMTFADNICDTLLPKDIQAMEFEADMYATDVLADLVRENIKNRRYQKLWGYQNREEFYSDAIKALCGFFSIVKYSEYKEQLKKSFSKSAVYDHPSFLLREYLVGELFLTWMDKYGFGRKDQEFLYYLVNNDMIFMKAYDEDRLKYQYQAVLDGSIKEHVRHVLDYCNQVLDRKTAPFTRLKASGSLTIKLKN